MSLFMWFVFGFFCLVAVNSLRRVTGYEPQVEPVIYALVALIAVIFAVGILVHEGVI